MVSFRHSVVYSHTSRKELRCIYNFIFKSSKSVEIAKKVILGIDNAAYAAALFPTKHRKELIFDNKNIRFTVKWSYKIIFEIHEDHIYILRIFDTRQNPNKFK